MGYKEHFLERAKQKYNDKYDYSLVEYINAKTKVKIKCNKCGNIFEKTPDKHLNGQECQCYSKVHKLTKEEFIEKSKIIHNDKYDYSLVEYKNAKTKVKIKCNKCGNIFEQTPYNHLNYGCARCAKNIKLTTKQFIEEAKQIHRNKYDYSLVEYINAKTKVRIKCPIHGVFEQTPDNHLNKKCGCGLCLNKTENYIQEVLEEKGLVFQKDFFRQKHLKI